MIRARDIAQLCLSSNLTGIVANKIEQSFYSVYSYSGTESIEHALNYMLIHKIEFTFLVINNETTNLSIIHHT